MLVVLFSAVMTSLMSGSPPRRNLAADEPDRHEPAVPTHEAGKRGEHLPPTFSTQTSRPSPPVSAFTRSRRSFEEQLKNSEAIRPQTKPFIFQSRADQLNPRKLLARAYEMVGWRSSLLGCMSRLLAPLRRVDGL